MSSSPLNLVLKNFQKVFSTFNKGVILLNLTDPDVTPRFFNARSIPFQLKEKVEQELERLVNQEVLIPVECFSWGSTILPVL